MIGKSTALNLALMALWGVILWRLSPDGAAWYNIALLGVGGIATWVVRRETGAMRQFAEKNPTLALMEGADIVELRRVQALAKGRSMPDTSPAVLGPRAIDLSLPAGDPQS